MSTFSANGSPTWTAGRFGRATLAERVRREDGCAANAVTAGAGSEEHDLVPRTASVREVQILMAEDPDGERIDQRIRLVHRVEPRLAADVRQPEAVTVERDPADHTVDDPRGVGVVDRTEAQRIHDRHRPRAHRDDVAHDATDAGRSALERLDVGRVVVALDLEGDRPALADIDHAGVLADADHEVLLHGGADLLPELAQVHLRRLVGAVLAPHHRVHRELGVRGPAAEDVADALVLVGLHAECRVGLFAVRRRGGDVDGVDVPCLLGGVCVSMRQIYRRSVVAMTELEEILRDAIERLAAVPDDALGTLKVRRFAPPKIEPSGRAWRLGSVLLARDGHLYRAGRTTRAVEPKQFLANKSNEAAERREEQRAAMRGRFPVGDTVHFGYEPLEPQLVDGVWMIQWSAAQPALIPLASFLDERIRLLLDPAPQAGAVPATALRIHRAVGASDHLGAAADTRPGPLGAPPLRASRPRLDPDRRLRHGRDRARARAPARSRAAVPRTCSATCS